MQHGTHVKKLRDPHYFGAYEMITAVDDKGNAIWQEMNLTIIKVVRETVKTQEGGEKMVVYFKEAKPMIFNAINEYNATKSIGSPIDVDWIGKKITVYVDYIKDKRRKEWIHVVRVRDKSPEKPKPSLDPSSDKWEGAKKSFQEKNCTMEQIKRVYQITPEHEELLKNG